MGALLRVHTGSFLVSLEHRNCHNLNAYEKKHKMMKIGRDKTKNWDNDAKIRWLVIIELVSELIDPVIY